MSRWRNLFSRKPKETSGAEDQRLSSVENLASDRPQPNLRSDLVRQSVTESTEAVIREIQRVREDLRLHDEYVRNEVAKQLTVQELIDALRSRVHTSRLGKEIETIQRRFTANHEKLLAILSADPTQSYSYEQLADMTRLTPDGVRSMISELSKMGCQFRKAKEGRRVVVALLSRLASNVSPSQSIESNESTR